MRVELINATNLRRKAGELTSSQNSFDDFIQKTKAADWETPHDMQRTFSGADIIGQNRVIFDLLGNKYRLICRYNFIKDIPNPWVILYICWVGSHSAYDKLNDNSHSNREPNTYTVWEF
ncbi:MAG: type II toxin-antitoxin system HigB family toxin [Candidatus Paceibacterota bacterium]